LAPASIVKGTLGAAVSIAGGVTYDLSISGVTADVTTVTVSVVVDGYIINGSPQTANIFYVAPTEPEEGVKITVGGVEKVIEVTGVSGNVEYLDDKSGYTFARSADWGSSFAYFAVDFDTDKLSDFGKVTFNYQGVSGDIGYKRIYIAASNTPLSNVSTSNQLNASVWASSVFSEGPQMNGTAETAVTLIIPKNKADTYDGSTVYFSIFINAQASSGGSPTTFKVSDIAFVKDGGAVAASTLNSIKIKTPPTKEKYAAAETFDPAGLIITANNLFGTTPETGYATDITYDATNASSFTFNASGTAITTATVMQTAYPDQKVNVTVVYSTKEAIFELEVGNTAPSAFDAAEGLKTGIAGQNKAVFDAATGIIDLTDTSGSALFTIDLPTPTSATGSGTIKIEYICKLVTGEPKVTWKTPSWGDPPNKGSNNIYPTLADGVVATLEMPETAYADATETIAFQRNGDANSFKIKIISVKIE
jgi:hypothetical protein